MFWISLLKIFMIIISPIILLFIMMVFFLIIYYLQGRRTIKRDLKKIKEPSFFKKVFWMFPKQWAEDYYNRDPYEFLEHGVHFVAGKQGSGKTLFITWYLDHLTNKYQKAKVITNYNYVYQDGEINTWKDLVFQNNDIYGMVKVIDELQNWFSSNQSKDFPPEMLTEVTQQRKQRSMILATGQVFGRVAKPIREQVHYLYYPYTFFGALTICLKYEPELNESAEVVHNKFRKLFIIPHTAKVRDSFDTYKKIVDLSNAGFNERNWASESIIVHSK